MKKSIEEILGQNQRYRADFPAPTDNVVRAAEKDLCYKFPQSYAEFLRLDGLNDLAFESSVLEPSEIVAQSKPLGALIAFAGNGCGDLFCWKHQEGDERVYIWSHEDKSVQYYEKNFETWLHGQRRQV